MLLYMYTTVAKNYAVIVVQQHYDFFLVDLVALRELCINCKSG